VRVIWFVCSGFQVKKTACNQRNETFIYGDFYYYYFFNVHGIYAIIFYILNLFSFNFFYLVTILKTFIHV